MAGSVPKLRRVIRQARELPLTVELPTVNATDGLDLSLALNTSKNVAVAVKEVWQVRRRHRTTDLGACASSLP